MPAKYLTDDPTSANLYDVAAIESPSSAQCIIHVGMSAEYRSQLTTDQRTLKLVHMRPPFAIEDIDRLHSIGSVDLTADEEAQIRLFLDELKSEYDAEMARGRQPWLICPHFVEEDDEFAFPRFSCVGFVIEAYRDANIDLLDTSDDSLPQVTLDLLKQIYVEVAHLLDNPLVRERFGLNGNGPWPVVMSGYVMHSLNRPSETIRTEPYRAKAGEEVF